MRYLRLSQHLLFFGLLILLLLSTNFTRLFFFNFGFISVCVCLWTLYTTLHPFNGLFSRSAWVSWHRKGKTFWILLEQEMMGWQWHQLDHMQIMCTSLQTDNHASTVPHHSVFYRSHALPVAQPPVSLCQSTEGICFLVVLICSLVVGSSVVRCTTCTLAGGAERRVLDVLQWSARLNTTSRRVETNHRVHKVPQESRVNQSHLVVLY